MAQAVKFLRESMTPPSPGRRGDYQSEVLGHSGKRRGRTLERPVHPAQRPSAIAAAVIFVEAWTMVVFP
jgi:hypothetical protein